MENKIPTNWAKTKLGDVVEISYGSDFRKKDLKDGGKYPVYGANGIVGYWDKFNKENEEVVMGCRGSVGNVRLTSSKSYISHNCLSLTPYYCINKGYLKYLLKSIDLSKVVSGSSQPQITITNLEPLEINIAPYNEQNKIEKKLDKLMVRVDDSKERLEKIQTLLERFRQSLVARVLKKYNTSNGYGQIKDIITDIRYGTSKKCSKEIKGSPVLRIPNIINGQVSQVNLKYAEFTEAEKKRLKLEEGDILIIRSNGSVSLVGRAALVSEKETGFLFAGYLIRLRLDRKKINPEFLNLVLDSYSIRYQIELPARSTSGVNNINSQEVKALKIPLPTLQEQDRVVKEIKEAINLIKNIEEKYFKAKNFTDKISNSIYAKAFRGELVEQDPNDEPASVLLEKIKLIKLKDKKIKQ